MEGCLDAFLERKDALDETDTRTGEDGYTREFWSLREKMLQFRADETFPVTEGRKDFNTNKNRYKDILPYDHSRVHLTPMEGVEGSDYINANFITGATGRQTYIAAQGPKPSTVCSFWQMLWENRTQIIVMACSEIELNKPKCERYWAKPGEELEFGGIKVTLIEEKSTYHKDYIVRRLSAVKDKVRRSLFQFHYTAWPDHGTPTSSLPLLDMMALARQFQARDSPHIVVHCSAGCGRTGTIIVVDYTWSMLKLGKLTKDYSVYDVIDNMRTERISLVQSLDQYIFVYKAVAELFERHLVILREHIYTNVDLQGNSMVEVYSEAGTENEEDIEQNYESVYGNVDPDDLPEESPTEQVIMTTFNSLLRGQGMASIGNVPLSPRTPLNGAASPRRKAAAPPVSPRPSMPESQPQGGARSKLETPKPAAPQRKSQTDSTGPPGGTNSGIVNGNASAPVLRPLVGKVEETSDITRERLYGVSTKRISSERSQDDQGQGQGSVSEEHVYESVEANGRQENRYNAQDYEKPATGRKSPSPLYSPLISDEDDAPAIPIKSAESFLYHTVDSDSVAPKVPSHPVAAGRVAPPHANPWDDLTLGGGTIAPVTSGGKGAKLREMLHIGGSLPVVGLMKYTGKPANVDWKGTNLSFPQRIVKPRGPREMVLHPTSPS